MYPPSRADTNTAVLVSGESGFEVSPSKSNQRGPRARRPNDSNNFVVSSSPCDKDGLSAYHVCGNGGAGLIDFRGVETDDCRLAKQILVKPQPTPGLPDNPAVQTGAHPVLQAPLRD